MVYLFLANGFEEIEALTVVDLLRRAELQVKTVSVMEDRLVYGAHGIGVEADILFDQGDYGRCAMLVLPGGMPGTTNLCNHRVLNEELKKFYQAGKPVGGYLRGADGSGKGGDPGRPQGDHLYRHGGRTAGRRAWRGKCGGQRQRDHLQGTWHRPWTSPWRSSNI